MRAVPDGRCRIARGDSIRCAKRQGAASIRTNNDSQNAPMLAINRKFGYRPEPGFYRLKATLA